MQINIFNLPQNIYLSAAKILSLILLVMVIVFVYNHLTKNYVSNLQIQHPIESKPLNDKDDLPKLNKTQIIPTRLAMETGKTDTVIYIYASGSEINDKYIYESVLSAERIGSTKNVKILMLYDRPNNLDSNDFHETRLMLISYNNDKQIRSTVIDNIGRANMADPQTLYDFLHFGMANIPAKKNILIIDGMGKGSTGLIYDESSNQYLTEAKFNKAISEIRYSGGTILDLIIMHNSFGGSIEVTSGLSEFAKYMIASPDYINLQSLDYRAIIQAANNSVGLDSKQTSLNIYKSAAFSKTNCDESYNFKLYDLLKTLDLVNGIETISSAYFLIDGDLYRNELQQALAKSTRLYQPENDDPVFSLDSFFNALSQSQNSILADAGKQLAKDQKASIAASCKTTENNLAFSFPESQGVKLQNHFSRTSFARLRTFKELLRVFFSDKANSQMFCYTGVVVDGQLAVINKNMGYNSKNKYICLNSLSTKTIESDTQLIKRSENILYQPILININNQYLAANLIYDQKSEQISRLEITGNKLNDFAFNLKMSNISYRVIGEILDKQGQKGYYYSPVRQLNTSSDNKLKINESNQEIIPIVSLKHKNKDLEIIDIKTKQSLPVKYKQTYKIFSLFQNIKQSTFKTKSLNLKTAAKRGDFYNYSFKNLEKRKPVTITTKFQYYEFIFASELIVSPDKTALSVNKPNYGEDTKYYKGTIIASTNNINFWDKWYSQSSKIK